MTTSTRTILVTGGSGFIGSNFVQMLHEDRPNWKIINLDALTYAGNPENLKEMDSSPNYTFVHGDICLLYTSPSPRDRQKSRMPSSA